MLITTWTGLQGSPDGKRRGNGRRPTRSTTLGSADSDGYSHLMNRSAGTLAVPPRSIRVGPLTDRREWDRTEQVRAGLRRGVNVAAALTLIVATAPLMLIIAVLVRLTSKGPAIFTQPRVGVDRRRDRPGAPVDPRRTVDHGGRIFHIYKFRTMRKDACDRDQQVWASREDPRITAVGHFLRRYRLDELPQLFNVLKGDMNLVGPRPEQPEIFKSLREEIKEYQRRQRVLPGITGLAQIHHKYDECVDDVRTKVSLDLRYLERESPLEDLRIMVRTVPVMLSGRGSI